MGSYASRPRIGPYRAATIGFAALIALSAIGAYAPGPTAAPSHDPGSTAAASTRTDNLPQALPAPTPQDRLTLADRGTDGTPATTNLTVVVVDNTTGGPVVGAEAAISDGSGPTLAWALTNGTGVAELDGLAPGVFDLHVNGTGYHPGNRSVTLVAGTQEVNASLDPLAVALVTVEYDGPAGGVPIVGAQVFANSTMAEGTTTGAGTVSIDSLPAGPVRFDVSAAGFTENSTFATAPWTGTFSVRASLVPVGGVLTVEVVSNASQHPLIGAFIELTLDASTETAETNASGVAWLPIPADGTAELAASFPGYATNSSLALSIDSSANRTVEIRLTPLIDVNASLSVLVRDAASNAPLGGAIVDVSGATGAPIAFNATNANGVAIFPNLPPAAVEVSVSLVGYRPAGSNLTLSSGAADQITILVSSLPTVRVTVEFAGPPGLVPIDGAVVGVSTLGATWLTAANGSVDLGPIASGSATVSAKADGFRSGSAPISIPYTGPLEVALLLAPVGGILEVEVVSNLSYDALAHATVDIADAGQNQTQRTNATGGSWFALGSFGTVTLSAALAGYHSNSTVSFTLAAPENRTEAIALTPLPSARVHVVGGTKVTNTSLYGAVVSADGQVGGGTDTEGIVTIGPLASGPETISAYAPGWGTNSTAATLAYTGTTNVTVLIYLSTGNLSVQVVYYANDRPLPGALVSPTSFGEAPAPGRLSNASGWSNFTGLTTGTYEVNITLEGYFASMPGVFLTPGYTNIVVIPLYPRLVVNVTVLGTVGAGAPASPIAGAVVSWSTPGDIPTELGVTGSTGVWSGYGPFPGRDEFLAGAYGYGTASTNFTVGPDAANDVSLEVVLAARTGLTVHVLDAKSGAPLSGADVTAIAEPYGTTVNVRTSSNGAASFSGVPDGTYFVMATALNYISNASNVELVGTAPAAMTLNLTPAVACPSPTGCTTAGAHPTFLFWSGGPLTPDLVAVFSLVAVIPLIGGTVYIIATRSRGRPPRGPPGRGSVGGGRPGRPRASDERLPRAPE